MELHLPNLNHNLTLLIFKELALARDLCCISIYIPIVNSKSTTDFHIKNYFSKINQYLKKSNVNESDLRDIIKKISFIFKGLSENIHTGKSLAIYLKKNEVWYYLIPKKLNFKVYVHNHFYLKPIAPLFNELGHNDELPNIKLAEKEKIKTNIKRIIELSVEGAIKTLFLLRDKDVFGEFDFDNKFAIPINDETSGTSLSNIAAIYTIINKGNVFLINSNNNITTNTPMVGIIS
jgi:hypothetical protein